MKTRIVYLICLVLFAQMVFVSAVFAEYTEAEIKSKINYYRGLIQKNPNHAVAWNNLCYWFRQDGQYDQAITAGKRAIALDPFDFVDYHNLGHAYREKGEYKKALPHLKRSIELEGHRYTYNVIAITYYRLTDFKKAVYFFKKALDIAPNYPKYLNRLSGVYYHMGEYESALAQINKVIEQSKLSHSEESAGMLNHRCLIYRKMGESEKAMLDAELAIKMAPDFGEAKRALGAATLDAGDYEQAIKILSKADQEDVFTLLLTAKAYAMQGDFKEAMRLYEENIAGDEKLLKRVPYISEEQELFNALSPEIERILSRAKEFDDKDRFQEALDEYSRAMVFMDEERKGEARDKLFEIIPRMPEPAEMSKIARKHSVRAEAFVKKGRSKDAIAELKKVINNAPFIARPYSNIAIVYAEMEDYRQAIHYMNIYAQVAPEETDVRSAENSIIRWELELELE